MSKVKECCRTCMFVDIDGPDCRRNPPVSVPLYSGDYGEASYGFCFPRVDEGCWCGEWDGECEEEEE